MDAKTISKKLRGIKNYHGFVFAKDIKPDTLKDGYYSVNLDRVAPLQGTHWTGLAVDGKNIYYFDSFGTQPPQEIVQLKRHGYRVYYSSRQHQNPNETNCGEWVIKFIKFMYKKNNDFHAFLFDIIR